MPGNAFDKLSQHKMTGEENATRIGPRPLVGGAGRHLGVPVDLGEEGNEWSELSPRESAARWQRRPAPSMVGLKSGCRLACFVRWSERMKRLVQSGQLNFFSPVCVR
ncbi:hypothetical protein IscW_ISCW004119 [Ixodes scapularis]|uniref:Uncharacterized protein n=1 Tax=Ixodes scapularis TaxID=6945 RepID=B7PHN2_IXOSC|nr:hypothetical protein IscW_ISCW004119 [Ixodes scapularis]|eukprot:XP_002403272.1 hypothetical protein IscW_ISCW004119 [Ixodes scapularis]